MCTGRMDSAAHKNGTYLTLAPIVVYVWQLRLGLGLRGESEICKLILWPLSVCPKEICLLCLQEGECLRTWSISIYTHFWMIVKILWSCNFWLREREKKHIREENQHSNKYKSNTNFYIEFGNCAFTFNKEKTQFFFYLNYGTVLWIHLLIFEVILKALNPAFPG